MLLQHKKACFSIKKMVKHAFFVYFQKTGEMPTSQNSFQGASVAL